MAVVGVHEVVAEPYAGGRAFGEAGPAVLRRLVVRHTVDPAHPANAAIVDLALAERGPEGLVDFDHDVVLIQPADPAAANGWALVDVVNRGGPTASAYLQLDDTPFFPQPPEPPPGDGHLLAHGWTLAFTGWQFDIRVPTLIGLRAPRLADPGIEGPVSYTARATSAAERLPLVLPGHRLWPPVDPEGAVLTEDGVPLPAGSWGFARAGDRPDGPVTGLHRSGGFTPGATYRVEYTTTGAVVGGCGLLALRDVGPWLREAEGMRRTVLFGVSQSGRVIRQLLHDGLNRTETGQAAHDAAMPVIAGGRRGQFNRRFAVPGTLPSDPAEVSGDPTYGALLGRAGAPLKVMAMNSSSEYWRGDGALVAPEPNDDVRVHLVAGTQHAPGYLPQLFSLPALGWKGRHGFNVVDYRPVLRALLTQLVAWVDGGTEPEPSTAPTADQLATREAVLARFAADGVATPRLASFAQPEGLVPTVDATGNEIGGIRLPEVAVPLGVHTGWNLRHADVGAPEDELFLVGASWWFSQPPCTEAEHRARADAVIDDLVARRFVLPADVERLRARVDTVWAAAIGALPPRG
ncbi:MAG: alpha/beta hydrolase domain-containing protein [Acidimicrobiia bacterium]|nr:alpha/beta hydrolase domain-containing protein [Acidimicrobiia bacterium]